MNPILVSKICNIQNLGIASIEHWAHAMIDMFVTAWYTMIDMFVTAWYTMIDMFVTA